MVMKLSLASLKAKKCSLFYPRDMTPVCTAKPAVCVITIKHFKKPAMKYWVSARIRKTHKKFMKKKIFPFDAGDTDKSVHGKYGAWIEKSIMKKVLGTPGLLCNR